MAIDRILVAIGPNDREHVEDLTCVSIDIADPTDTTVYLLHVFQQDEYEELAASMDVDPTAGDIRPDALAARHGSVDDSRTKLEGEGIDYEIRGVIGGKPAEQVLRIASENDADHIVVGGTVRSPTGKAIFGDHAQQILLNASLPVTFVSRE